MSEEIDLLFDVNAGNYEIPPEEEYAREGSLPPQFHGEEDDDHEVLDLNLSELQQIEHQVKKHKKKKAQKMKLGVKEFVEWILPMALAAIIALGLKTYVIINANIPSGSMENTIMTGDNVIGYRLAYRNTDPVRGDIVIFYPPDDETDKYVKRIIGMPGDHVVIEDAHVYVNGVELEEDYLKEEWIYNAGPYEYFVPENAYLMLGDNRNHSSDARLWENTYVYRDKFIAKAMWTYWPLSHFGSLTDTPVYSVDQQ